MCPRDLVEIHTAHALSEENGLALRRPEPSENLPGLEASLSTTMTMHPHPTSPRDSEPDSILDRLTEVVDKSVQHCENMQSTKHVTRVKYALKDLAAKCSRDDDDASVRACGYMWCRKLI
jgi:hypothetical protein